MNEVSSSEPDLVIQVEGLVKNYGNTRAVDGLDLAVHSGEVFSILGPNGAGKTTTVEVLEGLRKPDSGKFSVLGLDPWHDGYTLHKKVGVMPQGFRFFDKSTPREAISYYASLFGTSPDAEEILEIVGLSDAADKHFQDLSGGQKQKVGLALAMVNDATLVFLDEPTTGLDPQSRRGIWDVIRNLKKHGSTILLTTHYLEEAEQLSDRVAIMNNGKIIVCDTPSHLISKYGSERKVVVSGGSKMYEYLKSALSFRVEAVDSESVQIYVPSSTDILKVVKAIDESGLPYEELSVRRDSLEDVFIFLVGRMKEGELS